MTPLGFLLIIVIIGFPVAWLVSEFYFGRALRIMFGVLALLAVTVGTWLVVSVVTRFNYNAWYGGATGRLIETSLHQIEEGNLDRVLTVWRGLDRQYRPSYENRGNYQELVEEANELISGKKRIDPDSPWDASVFTSATWVGYWENDTGFWFVLNDLGDPFDVVLSGQPRAPIHSVSVSQDYRVLTFKEGEQWLHTLTLRNKYEGVHEWRNLSTGDIWDTDTAHKLVRATDEEKRMTQQGGANQSPVPPQSEEGGLE